MSSFMLTIVPVGIAVTFKSPLGNSHGRNTLGKCELLKQRRRNKETYSASVCIALETTVAATSHARGRAGVRGKVALGTSPDTTSLPVVGDLKLLGRARSSLPASNVVGHGGADVGVGVHLIYLSTGAAETRRKHTAGQTVYSQLLVTVNLRAYAEVTSAAETKVRSPFIVNGVVNEICATAKEGKKRANLESSILKPVNFYTLVFGFSRRWRYAW